MKPTNICFVTREYAHPKIGKTGGIGVFLKQFTQALKQQGFHVTVFTFGKESSDFMDHGVRIYKVNDLTSFSNWIKTPFLKFNLPGYISLKRILEYSNRKHISYKLTKFLKSNAFDIVEFHDYGGDAPFVTTNIPTVVRCHGTAVTLHEFMGYPLRLQDAKYERLFFKRNNAHVVAVSEYSAKTTQQAFGLENIPKVIYNGVQLPTEKQTNRYLDAPTIPYSIWYFGSVRERKGIDIACKVFNEVLEHYPKATFHVLGNNNNNHWNTVCTKLLTPQALLKTTYYGSIPNEAVHSYLRQAHIVLFPTYGENFSIALMEVMALGKLAITSQIPAFKEIIAHQNNGFMVTKDLDYLKWIIWTFQHPDALETLSRNALQTVKDRFNMDIIIKENIEFYTSVITHE